MHCVRSATFLLTFLVILQTFRSSTTATVPTTLSDTFKEHVKYLLNLIGIENEYVRFLTYMKIAPPEDNVAMKQLYDQLFSLDAYISDLVEVYGNYYTLDEIRKLIHFYSSPLGKKTLRMTEDIHKHTEDLMLNKISDYVFTAAEHGYEVPLLQISK